MHRCIECIGRDTWIYRSLKDCHTHSLWFKQGRKEILKGWAFTH